MKYNIIFMIALMVIIAVTVDRIEDKVSDYAFKTETTEFMQKGGRNTSVMGIKLCERINELEVKVNIKPSNCIEIYK